MKKMLLQMTSVSLQPVPNLVFSISVYYGGKSVFENNLSAGTEVAGICIMSKKTIMDMSI
jgi:hypothetical protein